MSIAVIGGGLLGVATAYELIAQGEEVVLFESNEGVGEEASFANGGMLTASMPDPWNGPGVVKHLVSSFFDPYSAMKLRLSAIPSLTFWGLKFLSKSTRRHYQYASSKNFVLADYSVKYTERLCEALNLEIDQGRLGTLKIFESAESMEGPLQLARLLSEKGLRYEELSSSDVVMKEPLLESVKDRIESALYFPDDRSGDAYQFVSALAGEFVRQGGQVRLKSPVYSVEQTKNRVVGLVTQQGLQKFDRVVIACGALSPQLSRKSGIALSIKPAKGYSVTLSTEGWNKKPRIPVIDDAMHSAVTPLGDKIRLAGTAEFTRFNRRIEQSRIDNLYSLFARLYPDLADQVDRNTSRNWTGFRPMSADGMPYIGETKVSGLYVNTGHSHLGWTMAMGSAKLLVQIMNRLPHSIDPEPYRPNR